MHVPDPFVKGIFGIRCQFICRQIGLFGNIEQFIADFAVRGRRIDAVFRR